MPILGIMASQISGHLWAPEGAYDALATVTVPSGGAATVTFAGIPTGYKHLQIRGISRSSGAYSYDQTNMQFNGDTGSNYSWHQLNGNGSSTTSNGGTSTTFMRIVDQTAANNNANAFGGFVIDVLDYANVNKNKTVRSLWGYEDNSSGTVGIRSGNWRSTSAVTSITFTCSDNWVQYTQFALFGVK
jgi:hypothetical protein